MIIVPLSIFLTVAGTDVKNSKVEIVPAKVNHVKEVIKVFPTPNNKGSITIHSANETSLSFYLFDLEGKLIYQSIIKKNEKQLIQGLDKGTYLYNAFQNDENLEGGKITLK
jgi:hypothetical protein